MQFPAKQTGIPVVEETELDNGCIVTILKYNLKEDKECTIEIEMTIKQFFLI